ncbi:unnamed protein product [Nippostrongylus brasiliensis]|uniref:E3 ubiquitin-protein ligase PPP1R11 n=1 Tax=Nippostrongylus brasiliensis TaxID=27835 RepID=A0A0N4XPL7_NIPBR|nr:unnamed protein product [Nippostrongylus brasiliensis]
MQYAKKAISHAFGLVILSLYFNMGVYLPTFLYDPEQLVLRLSREPERPHVNWSTDTVDNEHMGKKKSKCCCIYKKKKTWQDSSSSDDSLCEDDRKVGTSF